ncbi:phosphorothioated DNA-binding restriction endonuclease [Longimicrobium sp.]|uniref:phosphorothioated DNA-binding restriction endonuclease n=1 Tax=Longimicrobium sp. TaxID=2029185 RepID=UPI0039C9562A
MDAEHPATNGRGTRNDLVRRIEEIGQWQRGGERAPHKPLLLLYAIARAARREPRMVSYATAEPILRRLLEQFGAPGRRPAPEYPFWYLQNDGLWELEGVGDALPRRGGTKEPRVSALRAGISGGMPRWAFSVLASDRRLRGRIIRSLLTRNFPRSLHGDVCAELGIPVLSVSDRRRDAQFRRDVLRAYRSRCAVCGFDVRLCHQPFGIDAAHLMWWQAGGPCETPNGLALCALHHRAFDRGAIGVSANRKILISLDLSGDEAWLERMFYDFSGRELRPPQRRAEEPDERFAAWHRQQVFRGPARDP